MNWNGKLRRIEDSTVEEENTTVAKIAEAVLYFGRKRMKGLSQLDEHDHLVIFGYHADETEELVDHIRTDKTLHDLPIVLCSRTADEILS